MGENSNTPKEFCEEEAIFLNYETFKGFCLVEDNNKFIEKP